MSDSIQSRVSIYRRVDKESAPYGLEDISEKAVLFQKPTVLCCGGIYINKFRLNQEEDYRRATNGEAGEAHGFLGVHTQLYGKEPYDIVSLVYPDNTEQLNKQMCYHTLDTLAGRSEKYISAAARQFCHQHLFPLVEDKAQMPLPMAQLRRNLRNINVIAHSYGSSFMQQVGDVLHERMLDVGYGEHDIRDALSQILIINQGGAAVLGGGNAHFTTIDIMNHNDTEMGRHYPCDSTHKNLQQMTSILLGSVERPAHDNSGPHVERIQKTEAKNPLTILPFRFQSHAETPAFLHDRNSNHLLIYVSRSLGENESALSDKRGKFRKESAALRKKNTPSTPIHKDATGHQKTTYSRYGSGPHEMLLRTAICNAITAGVYNAIDNSTTENFTPLPGVLALLNTPREMRFKARDAVNFVKIARENNFDAHLQEALGMPRTQSPEKPRRYKVVPSSTDMRLT